MAAGTVITVITVVIYERIDGSGFDDELSHIRKKVLWQAKRLIVPDFRKSVCETNRSPGVVIACVQSEPPNNQANGRDKVGDVLGS